MNANMSIKRKERKEEQHLIKETEDMMKTQGKKNRVAVCLQGPDVQR